MKSLWCLAPVMKCPHCDNEWQRDSYEINIDDVLECPRCEKKVYVQDTCPLLEVKLACEPRKDVFAGMYKEGDKS